MADITKLFGGPVAYKPDPAKPFIDAPEVQLADAMRREGLDPPDHIRLDGKLHRFNTGKRRDQSAWYVAYGDGIPAGRFGDWRTGVEKTWRAVMERPFTAVEEMAFTRRMAEAKATRDAELERTREVASTVVDKIWSDGMAASPDHPYLARKGIGVNCARVTGDGRLMVPLYRPDGEIASLQYISDDGSKQYHPGSAAGGSFWSVGTDDTIVYIAEGFATAATVFEETGKMCMVAYSASNLVPTLEHVRSVYGKGHPVVLVADNDASGVGKMYAEQAAAKFGARIVVSPIEGDVNDYRQSGGKDLSIILSIPATSADIIQKLNAIYGKDLGDDYHIPNELVENLIVMGSQTVIYGDSNSGKTFLALSIAAAVAEGHDWFGRKTDQGVVIYLATESPASVRTRVQAIKKHYGISLEHLVIVQAPINFYEGDGDALDVIQLVNAVEEETGAPVRMIIGDTLARMSAGADENRGSDMGPVMARFDTVAKETGAAIVIIHHNGKNAAAGARGWSGIRAHIDTEIEVISDENGRRATITKQRELPGKGDDICFKLEVLEIGTTKFGGIATTCVAVLDDAAITVKAKDSPIKKHQKAFETAWWGCGAEDIDGRMYITRSALREKLEADGHAMRTIKNILNPAYEDKMIGALLAAGIIATSGKDGWIMLDNTSNFANIQSRDSIKSKVP